MPLVIGDGYGMGLDWGRYFAFALTSLPGEVNRADDVKSGGLTGSGQVNRKAEFGVSRLAAVN